MRRPERLERTWGLFKAIALRLLVLASALVPLAGFSASEASKQASWAGVVTYVVDGDTVYVRPLEGGEARSIRLLGMDAPEICQEGGAEARQALQARLLKRHVMVQSQRKDDFGRELATLYLGREDVGQWMVRSGQAWSYRFRQDPGPYAAQEQSARLLGRGLFASLPPQYPGDFRRRHGPCKPAQ